MTGPQAFNQLAADRRQVLAAGDSNSDATFVGDATVVSLVINRNQDDLMCRAYDGLFTRGGKWAINPMFIDPLPQHALRMRGGIHQPRRIETTGIAQRRHPNPRSSRLGLLTSESGPGNASGAP